jgi:uncharacterized SAM-binding protein YcdF (DUF218 family)
MKSRHKSKLLERVWRWGLIALPLLIVWPLLASIAAKGLIVNAQLPQADAIAVLAGSSTYLERTHRAAQLFHEGRSALIVLTNDNLRSGWSAEQQRNPFFVEQAREELKRRGVPGGRIEIIPGAVTTTYDEALRLRQYASERSLRSLLVVTSAYQSRRVLWTLRRVFQNTDVMIGVEAAETGEQSPSPNTWWLHRLGWKSVPGEYLKILYYRLKH